MPEQAHTTTDAPAAEDTLQLDAYDVRQIFTALEYLSSRIGHATRKPSGETVPGILCIRVAAFMAGHGIGGHLPNDAKFVLSSPSDAGQQQMIDQRIVAVEMLAVLKIVRDDLEGFSDEYMDRIDTVIAKAEGVYPCQK